MFDAQTTEGEVNPAEARLRGQIASCEVKIARYKATLDAGGDPAIVAGWISSTQAAA